MSSLIDIPYKVVISAEDSQIAFDATTSEQHDATSTVTEHPVEEGASIADHIQNDPDALQLNGIVSNNPILLNVEEDKPPSIEGGDPENRAQDAYNEFMRLKEAGSLLEVTTELRDYADMVITAISVRRDKETRHILDIGLTLYPIRKAVVETVDAPKPLDPVHKRRRRQGRKPKKDPKSAVEEKADSSLTSAANALDRIRGAGGIF
jgi:hypothetical protein